MHVLIAGAGIIGLTIAHGLTKLGISYTIFDKDGVSRPQGYGLTLQWGLERLMQMLPPEIVQKIESCGVRSDEPYAEGNFSIINAETGEPAFRIVTGNNKILRINRRKFRELLATGLSIHWNKELFSFASAADSVTVTCKDGTTFTGEVLIGADGANSVTRKLLLGELGGLTRLPFRLSAATSRWPYSAVKEVLSMGRWFCLTYDPRRPVTMFVSLQEIFEPDEKGGEREVEMFRLLARRLATPSDVTEGPEADQADWEITNTIVADWTKPLKSLVLDAPANTEISNHTFADWVPVPYEAPYHRVFLAGDAAHTFVPFRGEGVNYGFMTSYNLVQHLGAVHKGEETLQEAFTQYEAFARAQAVEGVTKSRTAMYDAHNLGNAGADSPFLIRREGNPETRLAATAVA